MTHAPDNPKPPLLVLVGPTAVGKTAVALEVAERLGGEIVSADSRLIYRECDIGTAKPTAEERSRVPHHLIDVLDPDRAYTLAQYQADAREAIAAIHAKGKLPILSGGTGFYVRGLVEHLQLPDVDPNPELRAELEQKSNEELHRMLEERDPATAARLHANDRRRQIRALEVVLTTGAPVPPLARGESPYDLLYLGLNRDREALYRRINQRVEAMMHEGLLAETRQLAERWGQTSPLLQTLGYAELLAHLRGELSLPEAVDRIKMNTRRYAKRQLTWFRREQRLTWLEVPECDTLARVVNEVVERATRLCQRRGTQ